MSTVDLEKENPLFEFSTCKNLKTITTKNEANSDFPLLNSVKQNVLSTPRVVPQSALKIGTQALTKTQSRKALGDLLNTASISKHSTRKSLTMSFTPKMKKSLSVNTSFYLNDKTELKETHEVKRHDREELEPIESSIRAKLDNFSDLFSDIPFIGHKKHKSHVKISDTFLNRRLSLYPKTSNGEIYPKELFNENLTGLILNVAEKKSKNNPKRLNKKFNKKLVTSHDKLAGKTEDLYQEQPDIESQVVIPILEESF